MKTILAYGIIALAAGALAMIVGLGGLRRAGKWLKQHRGCVLPLICIAVLIPVCAVLAARVAVMPSSEVRLMTYGTKNEASSGNHLLVRGTGSGFVEMIDPAPVCSGGWARTHVDICGRWETDETELAEPEIMTVQVPVGTKRWISFGLRQDGGQVLVSDGDFLASVDTYGQDGTELRLYLPDSGPAAMAAMKKTRLLVYGALTAAGYLLMAGAMLLLRHRPKRTAMKRNGAADFYRVVFALIIVFYHCSSGINKKGYLGVEYFFLLAGWLLMEHYERRAASGLASKAEYARSRLLGLWPAYALRWLAGLALLFAAGQDGDALQILGRSFSDLLMLQSLGVMAPLAAVDGTAWYVSALVFGSLAVYMLLCWNKDRFLKCIAPIGVILLLGHVMQVLGCLDATVERGSPFMTLGFWRGLAEISLGCLLCAWTGGKERNTGEAHRAWMSVLEAAALAGLMWCTLVWRRYESDVLPMLLLCFLLTSVMRSGSYLTQCLSGPVSVYLGRLTLVVYLFHKLVNQVLEAVLPGLQAVPMALLTMVASLALAAILTPGLGWVTGHLGGKKA